MGTESMTLSPRTTLTADDLGLKVDGGLPLQFMGEAGYFWHYLGEAERAAKIFDALSVIAPDDPVGPLGRARVAIACGQFRVALNGISVAMRRKFCDRGDLSLAMLLRGDAFIGQGLLREAGQAWDRAIEIDPTGSAAVEARTRKSFEFQMQQPRAGAR